MPYYDLLDCNKNISDSNGFRKATTVTCYIVYTIIYNAEN